MNLGLLGIIAGRHAHLGQHVGGEKRSLAAFLKASDAFEQRWVFQAPVPGTPPAAMLAPGGRVGKSIRVAEGDRAGTARVVRITPQVVLLAEEDFLAVLVR